MDYSLFLGPHYSLFIIFGSLFTIHFKKGPLFTNHYTPSRPSYIRMPHTENIYVYGDISVLFRVVSRLCLVCDSILSTFDILIYFREF